MTTTLKIHVEPLPEGMWADDRRVDAFEEMYRRCFPPLVSLCRRSLGGRGDPEALAQEAFVRAWVSLDRFSGARPFWPWVATIARRLCIDHRRRLERELCSLQANGLASEREPVPPEEVVEADEEYASARLALRRLKPAERRVITLRDVRGWSYDEIARFEGVSIESIRGSLKRARASLRKSYAKVSAGAPAAVVLRPWRLLKRRAGGAPDLARRVASFGVESALAGDLVAGALAAVLLVGGSPGPTHGPNGGAARTAVVMAPSAGTSLVERRAPAVATAVEPDERRQANTPGSPPPDGVGAPLPLPPDGGDTPEDVVFGDIAASPSYDDDGTVFATGTVARGCPSAPCAALFRSRDGGTSWHRLPALGFTGGSVVVPPTYSSEGRLFAAGSSGLLASEDDGLTFTVVAPLAGAVAVSPGFAADRRVLIGHAPGWEYRDDRRVVQPSGMVVHTTSVVVTPAFSPSYGVDGIVFVGATSVGQGWQTAAVFRCGANVCERPAPLEGVTGPPALAVSPRFQDDGTVVAWRGSALFVSTDGGRGFVRVAVPEDGLVQDVDFDRAGRVLVATRRLTDGGGSSGGVFRSTDLGRTWEQLGGGAGLERGVVSVRALPDGRVIAALTAAAGGGLSCSADDGTTWAARCP